MKNFEYNLIVRNTIMIGKNTAPTTTNGARLSGGLMKFDFTPGGSGAMANIARSSSGTPVVGKDMMICLLSVNCNMYSSKFLFQQIFFTMSEDMMSTKVNNTIFHNSHIINL